MKKLLPVIMAALTLCSCGNKPAAEPDKPSAPAENIPVADENVSYTVYTGAVKADDIYSVREITLPETIDGSDYTIHGMLNGKIIASIGSDFGLLDTDTLSFDELTTVSGNVNFVGAYDSCIIFSDLYGSTSFDVASREMKSYGVEQRFNALPVLFDGKLCYESVTDDDSYAVFAYDIADKTTSKIAANASAPRLINGELWFRGNTDRITTDKLVNFTSGEERPVGCEKVSGYGIFGDRTFVCSSGGVQEIMPDGGVRKLIDPCDGEMLDFMRSNDFCLAWRDERGDKSTPCVFDVESDSVVYFDQLGGLVHYDTFLENGRGAVFAEDCMKICIFEKK